MTRLCVLGLLLSLSAPALAQNPVVTPLAPPSQAPAGNADLLLDQGKRLFEAFQYEQAVPVFDRLIGTLTTGQVQRPDLLVQAYELRARSRFNQGDSAGTEQDFSALLLIKPDFKLAAGVSPRVAAVLESVRKLTIGQILASMTPAGDVQIDGRPYALQPEGKTIDLAAGEHEVTVNRPGYRPIAQRFKVVASDTVPVALTLDRVAATLVVVSVPDGVEVFMDGATRGKTQRGSAEASAPLVINDLLPGTHRLQLRRDCFKDLERTITIDKPDDLETGTLRLTEAIANVKVQTVDSDAVVFLDGTSKGPTPAEFTVCEGPHVIEMRSPLGRFVDRREWKTGDATTLSGEIRSAYPLVAIKTLPAAPADVVRQNVEQVLAKAKRVLVYNPDRKDLDAALQGETLPADWLTVDLTGTAAPVPREVRRDIGKRLTSKFDTQGVAALTLGPDQYTATLTLLAAGSGEPDVITINLADAAAQGRSIDQLGAPMPPIFQPSLETSTVDVSGVPGAVVIRAGGGGAAAGLTVGDTIVGAAGAPVASVAELRAKVAALRAANLAIALDIKAPDGTLRKATATAKLVADTIPLRDRTLLYNRALVELRNAVAAASTPAEKAAAHLNLAIAHMHLANWDDAQAELKDAQLADGSGVSAGTVAYLTGLCLEAVGRTPDAQAAFTKAAAAPLARLSAEGPLVAPLAQQKLQRR